MFADGKLILKSFETVTRQMRGLALKNLDKTLTIDFGHTLYCSSIVINSFTNIYVSFESIIFYNSRQIVKFKFWLIRIKHRKHKHELTWKGQL